MFNKMQLLKRRFFAMRNGAVADSLRRSGAPYRIIFGLNLPQIVEIARDFGPDASMAMELRANTTTRESMLIAPMLFPVESLTPAMAVEWLKDAPTPEVVDVVCLKLIKNIEGADEVVKELAESETPLHRYAAVRLGANLLPRYIDLVEQVTRREAERRDPMTMTACAMLLDDIEWRREEEEEK